MTGGRKTDRPFFSGLWLKADRFGSPATGLSSMPYEIAMKALEKIEAFLEPEEHDALLDLVSLFRPYRGDCPERARRRTPLMAVCGNCDYEMALAFVPGPVTEIAKAGRRHDKCPRCFASGLELKMRG